MITRESHGTATKETASLRDWRSAVLEIAGVTEADVDRIVTRERLVRWFDAGEPVWMAADSLRQTVRDGLRHEKADREANYLYSKMAVRS